MAPRDHSVTLLTRTGCQLCDEAETTLRAMADELGFRLRFADVDHSATLRDAYGDRVPVVLLDGREHGYWQVETARLRAALDRPVRP